MKDELLADAIQLDGRGPPERPASVLAEATLRLADKRGEPPCEDCGGPWQRTGTITHHVCSAIDPVPGGRKLPTPTADADRKAIPVWTGCVRYFPSALLEVAKVSKAGNDQHNPGQPLHWAQGKSMNQQDTAMRHLLDADAVEGTPGELAHLAQAAWRVLARLQLACQREGAPLAPGARTPNVAPADAYARPNTGNHPDHPPVDGGYRGSL
jgi:hypothetical protein